MRYHEMKRIPVTGPVTTVCGCRRHLGPPPWPLVGNATRGRLSHRPGHRKFPGTWETSSNATTNPRHTFCSSRQAQPDSLTTVEPAKRKALYLRSISLHALRVNLMAWTYLPWLSIPGCARVPLLLQHLPVRLWSCKCRRVAPTAPAPRNCPAAWQAPHPRLPTLSHCATVLSARLQHSCQALSIWQKATAHMIT